MLENRYIKIKSFFAVLFVFSFTLFPFYGHCEETCVKCHTDEDTIKSLYKHVKIESSEGEG